MSGLNYFPTISFVTPTYNAGRCLRACLESIRNQEYPQDKIEILIADGGSQDNTCRIADEFGAKIFDNPYRLAEYGLAIAVKNSTGEFLVLAASDNELIGKDWLKNMLLPFFYDSRVSAEWGRLKSASNDCSINHYYALIQNDPLTFFVNKNLDTYIKNTEPIKEDGQIYYIFDVEPVRPLPWGANCLIYKSQSVKKFWQRSDYIGDNDVFQMMVEIGSNRVAYNPGLKIYHHTVGNLFDWIGKWKRNFKEHFLNKLETRNLNWAFVSHFEIKVLLWCIYSIFIPISSIHSIILAFKYRNIFWLYHSIVSFSQALTYFYILTTTVKGRRLVWDLILRRAQGSRCLPS